MMQFRRAYIIRLRSKDDQIIKEFYQDDRNDFSGLRVFFEIKQLSFNINPVASLKLYNLSDKTMESLNKTAKIEIFAGYKDNISLLYKGSVVNIYHLRQLPESLVEIWSFDYIGKTAPLFSILKKGITALAAFEQIATEVPGLVVNPRNLVGTEGKVLNRDISIDNIPYLTAFNKVASLLGLNVWITNQVLFTSVVNQRTQTTQQPIDINANNGMIGSPVYDLASNSVTVTTLLNPKLLPGTEVQITSIAPEINAQGVQYINYNQSKLLRGIWTINYSIHYGDSRGDAWYSQLACYGFIDTSRLDS
jgi:hypothetical protein